MYSKHKPSAVIYIVKYTGTDDWEAYSSKDSAFEAVPHLHPVYPNATHYWMMDDADNNTQAEIQRVRVDISE